MDHYTMMDGLYIWIKANEYVKEWLPDKGYTVLESAVFEDCIGYRCNRKNYAYTVFMYAYGKDKTVSLDGEYCSKLEALPFSERSTILILYLNVHRYMDGAEIKCRIRNYFGSDEHEPELWRLTRVNEKPILVYYDSKEMMDQVWQLMYAFNREDTDVYDCIITDKNPSVEGCTNNLRCYMNAAFYYNLRLTHQKHGDMKLGYVRYNDMVYSSSPYVEGLGFFTWLTDPITFRILEVICHPFDEGKPKVAEFIKTGLREPEDLFDFIPGLIKAVPLSPVSGERFAAKLFFHNGECRKYVLPLPHKDFDSEAISYMNHVFTDGIWASISTVDHHESRHKDYPECGPAITFKNGFYIAGTRCYLESEPYSEPELTDEIVYSDENFQIRKLWKWKVKAIYEDYETGLLKVLISGQGFNRHGKSVFASVDGRRLTSLTFDSVGYFAEGLANVFMDGHGYGFIDKDMNFSIPMKYDKAEHFQNGRAKALLNKKWVFIDLKGNETFIGPKDELNQYEEVGEYFEGLCRVSTLKLSFMDMAFYSEYDYLAGTWGFVNEIGEEVISPQYIYANDFEDGIAIVAKGKWTLDTKWDTDHNKGCYWTDVELWGGIDKNGNEVIPFIFDEIKKFCDCTQVYMAHYGGWENGCWGVIDRTGNWLIEPNFSYIDDEYQDGLFAFYQVEKWNTEDNHPLGIFDIKEKKVLFEPQFFDVNFRKDGYLQVETFDQELGRPVEKTIDREGKERFKSTYTSVLTREYYYEVAIYEDGSYKRGIVDKGGNVILPCIYPVPWNGFFHELKLMLFIEDGKQGMRDYEGTVIIPAAYHKIYGQQDPLLTVSVGDEENYLEGLLTYDGKQVFPAEYERIHWCQDKKHFFCRSNGYHEMYLLESKS